MVADTVPQLRGSCRPGFGLVGSRTEESLETDLVLAAGTLVRNRRVCRRKVLLTIEDSRDDDFWTP